MLNNVIPIPQHIAKSLQVTALNTKDLLHSQGILADRLPAVLIATWFLFREEALREPEGAVLSLSASNQHAYHKDDQKEESTHPHQRQLDPRKFRVIW